MSPKSSVFYLNAYGWGNKKVQKCVSVDIMRHLQKPYKAEWIFLPNSLYS